METAEGTGLRTTIHEALSTELYRQAVLTVAELDLVALAAAIEAALAEDDDGLEPDELSAANDG